jgi:pyruvate dehydrogenase kinase 2/3/4
MLLSRTVKPRLLRVKTKKIHPVSLKQLYNYDPRHYFLKAELPTRLNNCIDMINMEMPKVQNTVDLLNEEIKMLNKAPLPMNDLPQFTNTIKHIQSKHKQTMNMFKSEIRFHASNSPEFKAFLKAYYSLNLSVDLLMKQHVSIAESNQNLVKYQNPYNLLLECIDETRKQTLATFGFIPNFQINTATPTVNTFYIESHLRQILMELFQNSIQAIKRTNSNPKITIKISNGEEDLSIMVSDEAKGMPLMKFGDLFNLETFLNNQGLAYCTMLAEYFGGDLEMCSMENLGTDACLYFTKNGNVCENVPEIAKDIIDRK